MNSFEIPLNFELVGILLGLAIYNAVNLDLKFPNIVYKKLIDENITLKVIVRHVFHSITLYQDLKNFDTQLYNSLTKLLEFDGDVESTFYLTFSIDYDCFGEQMSYNLKVLYIKIYYT